MITINKYIVFISLSCATLLTSCGGGDGGGSGNNVGSTAQYTTTTIAGTGIAGDTDATLITSKFQNPVGIAVASTGDLYVTANHAVRKISFGTNTVSTFAGDSANGGDVDLTGVLARFNSPKGIAVDATNLYVSDFAVHKVKKITLATAVVTTLAGTGAPGSVNGDGVAASFNAPFGVAYVTNKLVVAETANNIVRAISTAGLNPVTLLAGTALNNGSADGTGAVARFNGPSHVASNAAINFIYLSDKGNHTIRKVDISTGDVVTVAGVAGSSGNADGTTAARFDSPSGVAVDRFGTVYVADSANHTIRRISSAGVVTTIAGSAGNFGTADGTGSNARFNFPEGLALNADETAIYVADSNNHVIRKITIN